MRCPGQDSRYWKPDDIFEIPCSACGAPVEFFKDDRWRECSQCGAATRNSKMVLTCAEWCGSSEACLIEEKRMTDGATHQQNAKDKLPAAEAIRLPDLVDYAAGSVVSRTLAKNNAGTITLFAFDEGQELSEHSAPFDALVQVLDGKVELTIGGEKVGATAGETVLMPANVPHAVRAVANFKMLLTMIRG